MESVSSDPLSAFRLDNRLIVVTGASEGIGRAFAEAFARAGARLVLASRRREKLEVVQQTIRGFGGRAEIVPTDVSKVADIRALGEAVRDLAREGDERLVLVNNAGLGFTKAALEVTEDDWDGLLDTHAKGTFFCSQEIGRTMIERGYGKIINMSSAWAVITDVGKSPYCAAKAAIAHLTAALSTEWAPLGVRVNALAPTTTMSDFTARNMAANPPRAQRLLSKIKLGRFAEPSDHVGAAIFLASAASDFVTGRTLFVDGGSTT
jgi:NAD(P)-dependent dehydrogenase (short-subunit alcohol dehydrogenase family)